MEFIWIFLLTFGIIFSWLLIRKNRELRRLNQELSARETELQRDLGTDPLTGLYNQVLLSRLKTSEEAVNGAVAVLDLDDFKQINDQLGHLAGDEVLREVGSLIRASIRKQDLAYRWGGDEFVLIFNNEHMSTVLDRMRQIQYHLWHFRLRSFGVLPLRISWGVIEADGMPLSEALAAADEQMYQMKRSRKAKAIQYRSSDDSTGQSWSEIAR